MNVELLTPDDDHVAQVVDVFCESFFDYPVMLYVLGTDRPEYGSELRTLIGFFVMARVFRKEYLFGVRDGDGLAAAAIVTRPDDTRAPSAFYEYRQEVWAELGSEAEARYDDYGKASAPFEVEAPHLHLNMIGVRGSAQGQGLGRKLLDRVHELSAADSASEGVTLTTEIEANVPLYRHFGYELVGQGTIAPGLTTWGFYRPDAASSK